MQKLNVGSRIKFKNMPATYPRATVTEVGSMSIKCKLDTTITEMGYEQDNVETDVNSPTHKPKLKREVVVFNIDDIEVI